MNLSRPATVPRGIFLGAVLVAAGALLLLLPASARAASGTIRFNEHIRPILSDNCFACHGFDAKERKADLRLDIPEGAFADLGGYRAIEPGNPEGSEVWLRLTTSDTDEQMPPPDSHKKLTRAQKEVIRKWIAQGADYEAHWSFVAPEKPQVPAIDGASNPIDAFLQARLKEEGLAPAEEATPENLIRRLTLDLTGLPPTPAEVDAFVRDCIEEESQTGQPDGQNSSANKVALSDGLIDHPSSSKAGNAYERLVDRLQARATYGEHMARPWLDLARYADTHGLHLDNERSMWPYRDWVVRALNENLPFDQFTRWQLAGDLLPAPTRDQLIASGFNRCNVSTSEGGSIDAEFVYRYAVDRTSTAVEVWMGLTAGCAVCHDHKFDPLTTRDYYSLYAFFHSAADPPMDGNRIDTPPILKLTGPDQEKRLRALDAKIAAVDQRIADAVAAMEYTDPASLTPPPPARTTETVWFEDGFPRGAKAQASGAPQRLVREGEGEVFSGKAALIRSAEDAVAQDFFSEGAEFSLPARAKLFAYCFLDPADPPEAIMLQFHTDGWKHRAVWGAEEKIAFGKTGTPEKFVKGPLPAAGEWVRLEIDPKEVGLKGGSKVTGFAFTQFGGTVSWDRLGAAASTDPANDPAWSWEVWKKQNQGKPNTALPEDLRLLVRGTKVEEWPADKAKRVYDFWLANVYAGARDTVAPFEAEKAPFEEEKTAIEKAVPLTFVMADLPEPRESFVMERGAYDKPGEKVARGVPAFLPPLPEKPADRDYNRLDLADWLVSGRHPLTARVTVNRFWQQFFGTGLVRTSADFGSQGEPPSHPELLDWLAVQFVEDGWDMKRLVKRMVTSHAYRQSSRVTPDLLARDPDNRLLARGPRLRLDAEVLRDQALFVSGLLVPAMGGKAVNPYQPPEIWEPVGFGNSNTRYYKQGTGEDLYRRSLYTFLKRTAPPPFMSTFDAPNREQSCTARGRSNTPLQALQLMNDVQHVEAARHFAARMLREGGDSAEERLRWGWRVATARFPDTGELDVALTALARHRDRYGADKEAAVALISYGESTPDPAFDPADLAAWTMIANLLLNLDETLNKN